MARFATDGRAGVNIDNVDTVPKWALGAVVRGYDDVSLTEGEYMYVRYKVAVTEGQVVLIDHTGEAILGVSTQANSGMPVGFALGTAAIDNYGFCQISGKIKVKTGTVAAAGKIMLTAVGGTLDDAAIAGAQVIGGRFDTADGTPAAGFAYATINNGHVQSQIT